MEKQFKVFQYISTFFSTLFFIFSNTRPKMELKIQKLEEENFLLKQSIDKISEIIKKMVCEDYENINIELDKLKSVKTKYILTILKVIKYDKENELFKAASVFDDTKRLWCKDDIRLYAANIYTRLGEYNTALEIYLKSYSDKNFNYKKKVLNEIPYLYIFNRDYNTAKKYFKILYKETNEDKYINSIKQVDTWYSNEINNVLDFEKKDIFNKFKKYIIKDDIENAQLLVDRYDEIYSEDYNTYIFQGILCIVNSRLPLAQKHFKKAIELDNKYAYAYNLLAITYFLDNDYISAISTYFRIIHKLTDKEYIKILNNSLIAIIYKRYHEKRAYRWSRMSVKGEKVNEMIDLLLQYDNYTDSYTFELKQIIDKVGDKYTESSYNVSSHKVFVSIEDKGFDNTLLKNYKDNFNRMISVVDTKTLKIFNK